MQLEAEFWVAVAFVILVAIFLKIGVHKKAITALDARSDRIKAELDEARRLREEAEAVLTGYQSKRQEAEREAEAIVVAAKAEAERLATEAHTKVQEFVSRRTKMAEAKIAQAEAQAVADVKAAAAEAAVAAAEKILSQTARGKIGEDLISQGIKELKSKLN